MGRREVLEGVIARAADELALLDQFPDNAEFEDGQVIVFSRTFGNRSDTIYYYTAVKSGGLWYTTGKERAAWSWERLVGFHLSKCADEGQEIWVATEWETL